MSSLPKSRLPGWLTVLMCIWCLLFQIGCAKPEAVTCQVPNPVLQPVVQRRSFPPVVPDLRLNLWPGSPIAESNNKAKVKAWHLYSSGMNFEFTCEGKTIEGDPFYQTL